MNSTDTLTERLFRAYTLDISQSGHLAKTAMHYLEGNPALRSYFEHEPKPESMAAAIAAKSNHTVDRETLSTVLLEQYANLEGTGAVRDNIRLLTAGTTYTVTTGHQLCLFTGPLYFIYKIVSAINLAQRLKADHPDHDFVPVYWMATEDHDFAEINHTYLPGKKLEWQEEAGGFTGEMPTAGIAAVLDELQEWIGNREGGEALVEGLRKAYLGQSNLADATRALVHDLFGHLGLVVIDANDKRLKANFAAVMRADLVHQTPFKAMSATVEEFQKDYKIQVNPRATNLFYSENNQRFRIDPSENEWEYTLHGSDRRFSQDELLGLLERHPERFSPNVVLRPVYQEVILPNLAYIGGGGELAYWLELKGIFEALEVPFPMLLLRNSVTVLNGGNVKKMNKLGLEITDLFRPVDDVVNEKLKAESGDELSIAAERVEIEKVFDALEQKAVGVDPTLKGSVQGERQKMLKGLGQLEGKLLRAEKKKHETTVNQIRGLHDRLFPDGKLQERHDNLIPFHLAWGPQFIRELLHHLDPFDARMVVLVG